jgi:hypothetical protein
MQSDMQTKQQNFTKTAGERHEIRDNNRLYNNAYGKYTPNRVNVSNNLDARFIKQELNANIKDLAYEFLGKPQIQKTTEWRYGNKGSISIHVAGTKLGLYSNFETGESGNALKLIQDQLNCDYSRAFKWGAEWLGKDQAPGLSRTGITKEQQQLPQAKQKWTPIYPAPNTAVDLKAQASLAYMLKGRQEIARYA